MCSEVRLARLARFWGVVVEVPLVGDGEVFRTGPTTGEPPTTSTRSSSFVSSTSSSPVARVWNRLCVGMLGETVRGRLREISSTIIGAGTGMEEGLESGVRLEAAVLSVLGLVFCACVVDVAVSSVLGLEYCACDVDVAVLSVLGLESCVCDDDGWTVL